MHKPGLLLGLCSILVCFLPAVSLVAEETLPRALVIGDSISMNYTPYARSILSGEIDVRHIGTNGEDTRKGLAQIETWLGDEEWDIIHFNWGLHDLKQEGTQVPIDDYADNLTTLVARLRETGAHLIWASTTPVPDRNRNNRREEDVIAYNAVAAEIMLANNILINDLYSLVKPNQGEWQRSGNVHFHDIGYEQMGIAVADHMRSVLTPTRVLAIADVHGLGDQGWVAATASELGASYQVVNQSLAGRTMGFDNDTSATNARSTIADIIDHGLTSLSAGDSFDLVVLALGTHDSSAAFAGREAEVSTHWQALVDAIEGYAWPAGEVPRVIAVTPPPITTAASQAGDYLGARDRAAALATDILSLAADRELQGIDIHGPLSAELDTLIAEGILFTSEGYSQMGQLIASGIRNRPPPPIVLNIINPADDDITDLAIEVELRVEHFFPRHPGGLLRVFLDDAMVMERRNGDPFYLDLATGGSHTLRAELIDGSGETLGIDDQRTFITDEPTTILPWHADFSGADGAVYQTGNAAWAVDATGADPKEAALNQGAVVFTGTRGEVVWASQSIPLDNRPVTISAQLQGAGSLDSDGQDYVTLAYRLDDGPEVTVETRIGAVPQAGWTMSVEDLRGQRLQVLIRAANTGSDEQYLLEEVAVTPSGLRRQITMARPQPLVWWASDPAAPVVADGDATTAFDGLEAAADHTLVPVLGELQ